MKQHKTLLELADDYAKAYFMGRGEDARKLLQAAIIQNDTQIFTEAQTVKDHEIALLVNDLTAIAKDYHDHQSLRQQISQVVTSVLKGLK